MIFVSTGGVSNKPAYETSKLLIKNGIRNIELSGGSYDKENLSELKKLKSEANFKVHNYFPPPEVPFVFNLGSSDAEILKKSKNHAIKAIQWAIELDSHCYSFHSGFLIDLTVNELGRKVKKRKLNNRNEGLQIFIDNVNSLADYSKTLGVELMIENNVLSYNNLKEFNDNPFLMSTLDETMYIMKNTLSNVNLLIDVAHLKVSSNSLGYDPIEFLEKMDSWIKAYHFSDNDGKSDSNQEFNKDSWFWTNIKTDLDYYSIEVYDYSAIKLNLLLELVNNKIKQNDKL